MILVTGGAGYVGSVLSEKLIRKNYKVRVFDNFTFGAESLDNIKNKIEIIKGDIRKPPDNIFKGINTVIHLAGFSNDPTANYNPLLNYQVNTLGTIKLAKAAKEKGVRRFIFGSSCSVYDQGIKGGSKLLTESAEISPSAPYSYSKYTAEKSILPLADEKFTVVVLRKGTVYGLSPRMRFDLVINQMVKDAISLRLIKVYCQGKQWRPFIDVGQAAECYIKIVKVPSTLINGQIFNLLSFNMTIDDLAKNIYKAASRFLKVNLKVYKKTVDSRSYRVSNEKIRKRLGIKLVDNFHISINTFIKKLINSKISDFTNPIYYNIDWMKLNYQNKTKQK